MRLATILTAAAGLALLGDTPVAAQRAGGDPASAQSGALFDDQGYRSGRYRTPVRADPAPAVPIDLAAALALEPGDNALFIDVMPVEGGVRDLVTGRWTLSHEHLTIPGALWYPETGRAPVDGDLWQALEDRVIAARHKVPDAPVVIFCRADCWMSWNAARRLAIRGIANIRWLAEGTDGWHANARPLVPAQPVETPVTTPASQEQQQETH